MQYLIIEKSTDELYDVIELVNETEKLHYEKKHPSYYLEEATPEEYLLLDEDDEW